MTITIPVSVFTLRIIQNEFGVGTIYLPASHPLCSQITIFRPGDDLKVVRLRTILKETVTFDINPKFAAMMSKNVWRIGFHLHKYHRGKLDDHIAAIAPFKTERKAAIINWLAEHRIEPDADVSVETLYRHSTRYFARQKESNIRRFRQRLVRQNGENQQDGKVAFSPYSDAELEAIATYYFETFNESFKTSKQEQSAALRTQLRAYVYRRVGNRTPTYTCAILNITERNLRYKVCAFTNFLRTAPPFILPPPEAPK